MPTPEEVKAAEAKAAEEAAAKAAAEAVDDDDEDDQPEGGDLKVALQKEREKRKAASKKAKELEASVSEMKPYAEEYKKILPYLPALLKKAQGETLTKADEAQVDEELREVAETFGLETEDGQPDIKKAKAIAGYLDRRAGAVATRVAAPALKGSATAQATQIKERAYKVRGEDGKLYAKREFIDKVFDQMAPEVLLNPDNAAAALVMARGLGGPPEEEEEVDEPIYTATPRRKSKTTSAELTPMGKSLARMRGKTDAEWQKLEDNPRETGWDLE